jgi:peptidyl-tRNA hydrolase
MRLSNKDANAAQDVINWATLGRTTDKIKVVEFVDKLSPDGQKSIDAFEVARMGKTLTDILKRYPVKSLKDLAITGRDLLPLKIKGKMIGTTLQYALKIALNSGKNDKKFLLRAIKKHILSEGRYLVEEIKYESILKYVVKPSELRKLLQLQKKISDPEMVPLKSQDLHITLINSPEYKQMRKQLKQDDLPDPDFRIDFEEPQRIEGANGRVSYYAKVKQQRELKSYVKTNVGHVEDHRIYHVSLANKTGNKGDSVAYV